MDKAKKRTLDRAGRARRVRKRVSGTPQRPRLCVRRSLRHISAQLVDDTTGKSLVQVTSAAKEVAEKVSEGGSKKKTDVSKVVGEMVALKAKERGIVRVVFDRRGYLYHGRVKALADAVRATGLAF